MSHAASQHDTETGLINGAIGTVLSISVNHVTVQFDHMSEPYDVEMVRSCSLFPALPAGPLQLQVHSLTAHVYKINVS